MMTPPLVGLVSRERVLGHELVQSDYRAEIQKEDDELKLDFRIQIRSSK